MATRLPIGRAAAHLVLGGLLLCVTATIAFAKPPLPPARPDTPSAAGGAAASDAVAKDAAVARLNPLSERDAALYRRIFDLQRDGDWRAANRLIRQLGDRMLMGHVQFQRLMHPTKYRSTFNELKNWLAHYADHPAAYRVYALAHRRQPAGAAAPKLPVYGKEHLRQFLGDNAFKTESTTERERRLAAPIRSLIRQGKLSQAIEAIRHSPLGAGPSDRLRADVAFVYLLRGDKDSAYKLASWAANRSRSKTSQPDWVAGLSAYALGRFKTAKTHFTKYAQSPHAGEWNKAAGAYWAARAAQQLGDEATSKRWWRLAAQFGYSFYGQLAKAKLGISSARDWQSIDVKAGDLATVRRQAAGRRALALTQVGEIRRADEELLQILGEAGPGLSTSITRVAEMLGLPQTSVRGGFRLAGYNIKVPATALYPQPNWSPSDGLSIDRALIWAFVRQESLFNPRATSSAGARGLMQLMPSTANYMAGDDRFKGRLRDHLYEPAVNLSIGQRYLRYLMGKRLVGSNMFRLAVAYNAGVGNLAKWQKRSQAADDPLMFIETLPALETRLFVERIMANFWLYRQRLGQPVPSLEALSKDRWPQYRPMDGQGIEVARDRHHGD